MTHHIHPGSLIMVPHRQGVIDYPKKIRIDDNLSLMSQNLNFNKILCFQEIIVNY